MSLSLNDSIPSVLLIFKAQIACNESINVLSDNTKNDLHLLTYLASTANEDVLYYHQVMKADDLALFHKAMATKIEKFKEEKIFILIPLKDKPKNKSLISFIWLFK